ncbi:hypothetical protein SEA_MUSETTA_93 [Microbacterium phage Musetta]|nr:hypothetical protein SEA_LYELL_94 [Microbacterium phage Lyell]AXH50248.1 hypothetical protein SEA_MUSETTA_93 [Microbacterium phage Musetta]QWS69458.1 hypothetical protein SEA_NECROPHOXINUS_96 [Microbacterium phage Necrophoxinus]URM87497.1 hypothetical protein SEA_DUSTYDINO_98 [Microbacterium phage DustyDino]UVK62508.1 membrane protein [Microbacterium phage Yuma]WMI33964.1 hypothetical protein SEA_ERENYEAGER_94 [Microbacterium phage Erenyeager]
MVEVLNVAGTFMVSAIAVALGVAALAGAAAVVRWLLRS